MNDFLQSTLNKLSSAARAEVERVIKETLGEETQVTMAEAFSVGMRGKKYWEFMEDLSIPIQEGNILQLLIDSYRVTVEFMDHSKFYINKSNDQCVGFEDEDWKPVRY